MGLYKCLVSISIFITVISILTSNVYGAVKFKDVPENHWAFKAIAEISEKGLIVGDASGNFKPDAPIDKFETTRILAKYIGYKFTNVTEEERAYYRKAYDKNKAIITQYAKPFTKWKSAYDYEIAFLLEKEIYTVEDLSQFIVKDANGVQQFRALSRQEAAVYLVKLMGLKSEALSGSYNMNLADDADIKRIYKPYVYYSLKAGIINSEEGGIFKPNGWVTRALMSLFLYNSLNCIDKSEAQKPVANSPSVTQIISLTGNITKVYPEQNSIQITSGSGMDIYQLSPETSIYVDSFLKTRGDLKEGMAVKAVLANGKIIDIQAFGLSTNNSIVPVSNRQISTVEGILKDIRFEESGIAVDLTLINPDGKPGETKTFVLDKNHTIARLGAEISAEDLKSGDVVIADISGGVCLRLLLAERDREIRSGTLLEKKTANDVNILLVKDQNGSVFELKIDEQTKILRQNNQVNYAGLRIGDMIDAYCTYDRLTSVSAHGLKTELTGALLEILIASDNQSIVLTTEDGQNRRFYIIPEKVDVYKLRIGTKVRISLDSWEVEAILQL